MFTLLFLMFTLLPPGSVSLQSRAKTIMTFTFERRLETFNHFKWPHSKKYKSQPEDFAQAGFYCRPMANSDDTVSCFLCLKSLDGWEPTDSAWQEHKSHSAHCPLVTLNLLASRQRTFDKWTGQRVKGGTAALADAGFFYFPKTDGDDTCICYQCGLALDGWEQDDDPYYEHSRRRPNCPHVVNKEHIHPASFDFILSGKPDDFAVKDVTMSREIVRPPVTPARRRRDELDGAVTARSTVKGKRIRISSVIEGNNVKEVEQSQSLQSQSLRTPLNSKSKIIISSTVKKNNNKKNSTSSTNELFNIFPALKKESGILNWTMGELMDRLVKEKVKQFEEFLREQ